MIGDTDATTPIFQDDAIQAILNLNSSQGMIIGLTGFALAVPPAQVYSYGRTAAMLLNSIGSVRARNVVKKILDVDLDGQAASKALKDLGQSYIDQEKSGGYFAVSEMVQDAFSMRDRLWKMLYRIQA